MATAVRETIVHNPGGKRVAKSKRKMSAKQIKFFGSARQRAALKHKRKSSHRPRTKARKTVKRANPVHHRTKARKRKSPTARKRNLGAIYALTANPAKGRKRSMAKTKKRKSSNPHHKRAGSAKRNPGRRPSHRRRSNPGMFGGPSDWLFGGVGVLAGVVGTRALPQLVLGSSNTGFMGYLANAASTALLTVAAHFAAPRNRVLSASVLAGGVASIISRVIQDYSLLGSASSQLGLGDYVMLDFLTPQTLTPGNMGALGKPGWGTAAPALAGANVGAGMTGIYGPPLY
jgi:hypothetical protein